MKSIKDLTIEVHDLIDEIELCLIGGVSMSPLEEERNKLEHEKDKLTLDFLHYLNTTKTQIIRHTQQYDDIVRRINEINAKIEEEDANEY